jgi:predicted phage tail protein
MSLNRTAKGIVLVPSLLLGGAFLAAAAWGDSAAADNKTLALTLGGVLMGAGLLAQLLPESAPERELENPITKATTNRGGPSA